MKTTVLATVAPSGATPPQPKNAVSLYGLTPTKSDEISARFWEIVNRRINEAPELVQMLADGYQPEMTGGGCLAWRKNFHDGSYLLITYYEHDIGGEPEDPVWIVGRYTDYGHENRVEAGEFLADVRLADATAFARELEVIYGRQCCHRQAPSPGDWHIKRIFFPDSATAATRFTSVKDRPTC